METLIPFLSLIVLMAVHLLGDKFAFSKKIWHSHFLSASGGITAAYVFVNFLPKLCSSGQVLSQQDNSLLFLAEKHVFVLALLGFLFYYGIDFVEKQNSKPTKLAFQISIAGYLFFNFLMNVARHQLPRTDKQALAYFAAASLIYTLLLI